MIDILKQKHFFPLKNFEDVEKLFEFNIDESNGEPNLALLSIVAGLIEHSLVTVTDKDDLAANSRPVNHRKEAAQRRFSSNRWANLTSSSSHTHQHLSSTSNEHYQGHSNNNNNGKQQQKKFRPSDVESNEAGYVSSDSNNDSEGSMIDWSANDNLTIPEIEFEVVETLYKRFVDQFRGTIDFKDDELHKTNLKIKRISDSVWEHLSNSYYKDKTHLQSIFSYLTTNKLDCFGLAFAVIAGCQILNLKNIYLALSEDHAWVMFDLKPEETKSVQKERELAEYTENNVPIPTCALYGTCEVTWHGKANSDKRGQPVTYKNCWLYTNGYAVKCDTKQCVAALINSINPSINSNTDSEILALLQQRLLWLLFHRKDYFPMSLGNLGELEDLCPTPDAPLTPHDLFNLGIDISRTKYNDSHVYPYTYLASYFYNHGRFKEALETWADSSAVMTKYNYSRDDEEIYKEFFEVANELIPSMLKVLTAGGLEPGRVSLKPFLQDPECLALILKFYDNICCWEEGSSTPVLHIGWAKNFVATVLKFNPIIRSKIKLLTEEEWNHNKACASECEVSSRADQCSSTACDQSNGHKEHEDDRLSNEGTKIKHEPDNFCITATESHEDDKSTMSSSSTKVDHETSARPRKRALSINDKVETSVTTPGKLKLSDAAEVSSVGCSAIADENLQLVSCGTSKRENRLEFDNENNVAVILKSRKIAGVRDLLQAERLNKTAIELQLTAQSQCAVRGRSNSNSYTNDFIPFASLGGSSTRSKRLHR
uniref:Menin n=1 Tax=Aceria tosichella TaxID=561515 RepID=A0A6G1S9X9_9ACAR